MASSFVLHLADIGGGSSVASSHTLQLADIGG